MIVGGVRGGVSAAGPARGTRRPTGGFALPGAVSDPVGTGGAGPMAEAAALDGIGAFLLLQEVDDAPARDRSARRRADAILAELRALQRALLDGAADAGQLARLSALSESVPVAADPGLAALVRAIGLRAAVELARRHNTVHDRSFG